MTTSGGPQAPPIDIIAQTSSPVTSSDCRTRWNGPEYGHKDLTTGPPGVPLPRSSAARSQNDQMTPLEVLHRWFEAHERGDLQAASAMVADDADITVPGASLRGFDAFIQWHRERVQQEGPSFTYVIDDILSGERYAAAVLTLSTDADRWRQVAVYQIDGDIITAIWAAEHH